MAPYNFNRASRRVEVFVCLALVGSVLLGVKYGAEPFRNGFFCSDETLSYPYRGSTVPTAVNVIVSMGVPIACMLCLQLANSFFGQAGTPVKKTRTALLTAFAHVLLFIFGALCTQLVCNVCKVTAGRLRPHFFDVCQPLIEGEKTCPEMNPMTYVTNYTCLGNEALFPDEADRIDKINEARLSFLSGHSSLSSYGMVFLMLYVQFGLRQQVGLVKQVFQIGLLLFAIFVGMSRISDHKHHPTDVIAGMLLGAASAIHLFLSQVYCWTEEVSSEAEQNILHEDHDQEEPVAEDRLDRREAGAVPNGYASEVARASEE